MGEGRRGVAYEFWLAVEKYRVSEGLTKTELAKRAGVHRTTPDSLRDSSRQPTSAVVHGLADVIGMERDEAEVKAGLVPPARDTDVRTAIAESRVYTEAQRNLLLSMIDEFEQVTAQRLGQAYEGPEESAR